MTEKPCKKTDMRVTRTKKYIRRAVVDMLAEKDMDSITVTDVASAADINRKTFYTYYPNVKAVIEEISDEFISAFEEDIKKIDVESRFNNPCIFFDKMTELVDSNMDFYSALFRKDNKSNFFDKVTSALEEKVIEYYVEKKHCDRSSVEIVANYCISGGLAAYYHWFNSDRSVNISIMDERLGILIMGGINGIMKTAGKSIRNT